jgi:hypothetical protein
VPALEREATALLAEARAQATTLHLPGVRARHRRSLERGIALAEQALAALRGELDDDDDDVVGERITALRTVLLEANAARAEDARYGAGQLSRGSQRAPTCDDCDDGWQRVESIVANAETSAREARRLALDLDTLAARRVAQAAETSRDKRDRSSTSATTPTPFTPIQASPFGEGFYLAAAALLTEVTIQLEEGAPHSRSAERFIQDTGLASRIRPYRPRPRANKQLTEIVARAFRADPARAQAKLRAAFLGDQPIRPAIVSYAQRALAQTPANNKVLLWIRHSAHHRQRNTDYAELCELTRRAKDAGLVPILVGDALRDGQATLGAVDMTLCWQQPLFQGEEMRRAQLQLYEQLKRAHGLVGQLGVTTAGMDGPALMGLPTMYITDVTNVRMSQWVGSIPGYQEIVRDDSYLARIGAALRRWAAVSGDPG